MYNEIQGNCLNHNFLFLIAVILDNQKVDFVRYKGEFAITMIVITEFDCVKMF
jgi:hypothetical protein